MMFSSTDAQLMRRALDLAANGLFTTDPNPRVGCVIVREGQIVGEGWHQRAGEPHAEVHALQQAGDLARQASVYLNLEPCSHQGRTPPCSDALIRAGVSRVVVAMQDPNPLVNGEGAERLRQAGIRVDLGLMQKEAIELNLGFISRIKRQQPWVRMKLAASLDGKTALQNRQSQWITDLSARRDGHAWRARASAILTGIGTVRDDDPLMNVRLVETTRQPVKVLVDSRLDVSADARMLASPGVWIVTALQSDAEKPSLWRQLSDAGHRIVSIPNAQSKVDLKAMLRWLANEGVNELHVEAGSKLNGSLFREHCVDELLLYFAPQLLGPGLDMIELPGLEQIPGESDWAFVEHAGLGRDLRLRLCKTASLAAIGA
ncbi:MAG: bifunctional diaminohydroxyphosphoribosylaminopyrimidine deaminase/5-amino-6-(5-phosphoribosylamino)uracil reductase RibD [Betaproteobacteria bacterium]|nr:bifunctional diaminohydroxyphosphoribosylaminopyrimidine deaminase/5-amino-6-(5-phosphoribosylamino)uracil reductase RibD [Betaproteobacteria bacterium]